MLHARTSVLHKRCLFITFVLPNVKTKQLQSHFLCFLGNVVHQKCATMCQPVTNDLVQLK